MKCFDFKHEYNKLDKFCFTTIRGKSRAEQLKVNDILEVSLRDKVFGKVRVASVVVVPFEDIPLHFLQTDMEFAGFKVNRPVDAFGLINSMRMPNRRLKSMSELVSVITLYRVDMGSCENCEFYHTEECVRDEFSDRDMWIPGEEGCGNFKNWYLEEA